MRSPFRGRVAGVLLPDDAVGRWWLAGIVAVGAAIRVAWGFAVQPPAGPALHDPVLYLVLGDQLASGHGYSYPGPDGGVSAYYPPGYLFFLAPFIWLADRLPGDITTFTVAVSLNVVLSVVMVPLVFALGRRLADVRVGLVAAAVTALWPNLVFHSGVVLTETLFLDLLLVMLLVLLADPEAAGRPSTGRLVAVGALFGAVGLVRPVSFVLAPLFLVLWWRDGVARALQRLAILGAATVVVLVPWAVRSTIRMEAPVLLSLNLGDNLCIGYREQATGAFDLAPDCFDGYEDLERPEYETRRQSDNIRRAVTFVRHHPGDAVALLPAKARYTLRDDHDGLFIAYDFGDNPLFDERTTDALSNLADGYYYLVAALALGGVAVAASRGAMRDRRWVFFAASAPVQLLSPLLTFGDPRFKMPIYPVLAVCAAVAVVAVRRRGPLAVGEPESAPRTAPPADEGAREPEAPAEPVAAEAGQLQPGGTSASSTSP